jgi:glycosyltransferase involved in cell wall biosynthesis
MSGSKKLKLLLIAAGCDNAAVGEGGSTFQWVSRIGQRHDVTLLTLRNSLRPPTSLQLPHVRVFDWPELRFFEKKHRFNSMLKPSYVGLYFRARRWINSRLQQGETFDLVHQISPLALRYPSPGSGLGIPFIIGPLGGSIDDPEGFGADFGKVPWYIQLRKIDEWRLRHDPLLRRTYSSADRIIAVAPYVVDLLGSLPSHDVELMTETGVVALPALSSSQEKDRRKLKLLFVGRVIRSKGVRDAIRALAQVSDLDQLQFDVVGDGDDLEACKHEARELGLSPRVMFHGRVPRSEVDRFYAKADVFLFPSFREPSGNVVVEAMSYGLPVITADRGGPRFVVDESCGFRVPVLNPSQFAEGLAAGIRRLLQDSSLVERMGAAAREKIKHEYLWDAKVDRLEEIYFSVLSKRSPCTSVKPTVQDRNCALV